MLPLQKSRSGVAFPLEDQNVKREVTISHQTERNTAAHPKALWPSCTEGARVLGKPRGCSPEHCQEWARFKGKKMVSGVGFLLSVD